MPDADERDPDEGPDEMFRFTLTFIKRVIVDKLTVIPAFFSRL